MAVRFYDGARYSHVHVFDSNYDDDDATAHAEGLNSAAYGQSHFVARLMQTAKNTTAMIRVSALGAQHGQI